MVICALAVRVFCLPGLSYKVGNDRNLRSSKDRWMFVTTFIYRVLSNVSTQGHSSGRFFFSGLGIVATGREMKEAYVNENLMRFDAVAFVLILFTEFFGRGRVLTAIVVFSP